MHRLLQHISLPAILWADVVFPLQPAYDLHSMRAACSTRWERVNTTLLPERQWKLPDICSFELKLNESETEKVGDKCTPADLLAASNARPPHCRYSHVWCIIHVPWVYTAFHLFIRTVENILAWESFYWPFIIGIYNIFIFSEFLKLKVKYTIVVPSAPALCPLSALLLVLHQCKNSV